MYRIYVDGRLVFFNEEKNKEIKSRKSAPCLFYTDVSAENLSFNLLANHFLLEKIQDMNQLIISIIYFDVDFDTCNESNISV